MSTIDKIYSETSTDLTQEEFEQEVERKMNKMNGLLDEQGTALLVKKEVENGRIQNIDGIEASQQSVKFSAKVVNVSDINTFDRDDGSEGEVCNVEVADESGQIRIVCWDDLATEAAENLSIGDVIRISGSPDDGYSGTEINVDKYEHRENTEIDVKTLETYRVADLSPGLRSVTIKGLILDTTSVRTFERDDGTEGKVGNIVIGDKTGQVTLTMWGEAASMAETFRKKVSVEVTDGNVRKNDNSGELEIHINDQESIQPIDETIEYVPEEPMNIEDAEIGDRGNLVTVVEQMYEENEFERDDGSVGYLRNILVTDDTGTLRVTLWGEKRNANINETDKILITNAEIREGMEGGVEASIGGRSTINIIQRGAGESTDTENSEGENRNTGLSDYDQEDVDDTETEESSPKEPESEPTPQDTDKTEGDRKVEFTGTVLGTGDEITLDCGGTRKTVVPTEETDLDVNLGENITVRGTEEDGTIRATEYF